MPFRLPESLFGRLRAVFGRLKAAVADLGVEIFLAGRGRHGEVAVGLMQPGVQMAWHGLCSG